MKKFGKKILEKKFQILSIWKRLEKMWGYQKQYWRQICNTQKSANLKCFKYCTQEYCRQEYCPQFIYPNVGHSKSGRKLSPRVEHQILYTRILSTRILTTRILSTRILSTRILSTIFGEVWKFWVYTQM